MENMNIKVNAIFHDLDYCGNIVERKYESLVPYTFDSKVFIDNTVISGDVSKSPKLYSGYYEDFMKEYFNLDRNYSYMAYKVESEVLFSNVKFVFFDIKDQNNRMKWVMVDSKGKEVEEKDDEQ